MEHLLAALAGLRIDNCIVQLDGPEPPGLDGSAQTFVRAIQQAGTVLQFARRSIWSVSTPVTARSGGATITLHPATTSRLSISYLLDYGVLGPIARQRFTLEMGTEPFAQCVAQARTFVTEAEAHALRKQGVGQHLSPADLLVFGPRGPIQNALRFADEPARHKVLDLIGDLALCNFDLAGHVVAYRSGHALNVELARKLTALAVVYSNRLAAAAPLPPRAGFAPAA